MKKLTIAIAILTCLFSTLSLKAQTDDFSNIVNELNESVQEVSTKKYTYEQEIKIKEPGVLSLIIGQVDTKGSRTEFIYEFNLSDMDPIMVREVTEREMMFVQLIVDNNQRLVTVLKNGELDSYDKIVKIYAKDIDNARNIKELIKQAIPVAKDITDNKFQLNTYDEKIAWIIENVKDVSINDVSYQQVLTKNESIVGNVTLEIIKTTSKSSNTERFEFNIADINNNSINFKITGTTFSVIFETKGRRKLIKSFKDGQLSNYTYKADIIAFNIENARWLRYILNQAIPLAEDNVKTALPSIEDMSTATSLLSQNVKEVIIDDKTYSQTINSNCISSYNIVTDDTKKRIDERFEFNLSDINLNTIDYKIIGKKFDIVFKIKGGDKLIKVYKDDLQQNYSDDLMIMCEDAENARLLEHILKKAIPICEENIARLVPEDNLDNKINWLIENVGEVTIDDATYTQSLEEIEADNNKLRLTIKEVKNDKITEYIYEFNLSDINPNKVNYYILGKKLSVHLETNYNSKIIKVYKDGETQNFESDFNIYVNDIETARNIIIAIQEAVQENQ